MDGVFEDVDVGIAPQTNLEFEKELQNRKKRAQSVLSKALEVLRHCNQFNDNNMRSEMHESQDVRESIVQCAKQHSIDTIILGTRGLGWLKSLLLGSVSSYVLTHAHCSVLVVR